MGQSVVISFETTANAEIHAAEAQVQAPRSRPRGGNAFNEFAADAANLAPDELRFVQEVENEFFARWWERAKFMMAFLPVGQAGTVASLLLSGTRVAGPASAIYKAIKSAKVGAEGGRAGKRFTPAGKREIDAQNAAKHGGVNKCEKCGIEVAPGQRNERGVAPPNNQRERDHVIPKSQGGEGLPLNGQILCRACDLEKSDTMP